MDYLISIDIFNEIGYCEPTTQLRLYGIIDAPCPPGTISPVNFLNLQIEQVSIGWYWDLIPPDIEFDFQLSNTIENLNNYNKIITNSLMLVFEKNNIQVKIPFNLYSTFSLISGYKFFFNEGTPIYNQLVSLLNSLSKTQPDNFKFSIQYLAEKRCCKTAPYRNPILGYRKHLLDCSGNTDLSGCGLSGCGYTNDASGNVYKDNYAKSCALDPSSCYNPVIKRTQNRNGCVNESYNYSTNQYLTRRCLTFSQQEFNFQSQIPVDASGCCTKFRSCANCQYDLSGACDCSSNGFCTGINKLPCEVKNTKCFAIYKRSNPKFNRQGAVSGGSRINRLKYQTRIVAQGRKVNGRNNVINRRGPAANYMTSRPLTLRDTTCVNPPPGPVNLSGVDLSPLTLTINWSIANITELCRIAPTTGFTLQRTGSPFGHTITLGSGSRTYTYTGIVTGTYNVRIKSNSYYGSSDWTYLNNIIVNDPPAKITDLTGSTGWEQVKLSWTAPDPGDSAITDYEYKKDSDAWMSFESTDTSGVVTDLTNDTPYAFMVRAINATTAGPDSNEKILTPLFYPSVNTVGGEFIFSQGGGWGTNGMQVRVNQDPYLLKNVDPNGGDPKYVGFSQSSVGDPYILYCAPEGPPTYIPNQSGGLRLPVASNLHGALYPMKFRVEIDLPIAGWTDMGDCDIYMSSSFNAGLPVPRCTLLVRYQDLDNLGTGELNATDLNNWTIALGGSGAYIGQTIRITYVSGGT